MKNQNPHSKLIFNKTAISELNDSQLQEVQGGSLISVAVTVAITILIAD